uniref:Uncharacterized protein n=1 Tax=Grammatophora oceanica TaxID=210454 RepID=A0A6U5K7H5_9STRA|mmetsp:Transcript_28334/g.41753  ORF Transcript_28334/g.41753 Transcript_28334/m.41753 type:complete len:187 (+) Transcript_28334:153-713(+)
MYLPSSTELYTYVDNLREEAVDPSTRSTLDISKERKGMLKQPSMNLTDLLSLSSGSQRRSLHDSRSTIGTSRTRLSTVDDEDDSWFASPPYRPTELTVAAAHQSTRTECSLNLSFGDLSLEPELPSSMRIGASAPSSRSITPPPVEVTNKQPPSEAPTEEEDEQEEDKANLPYLIPGINGRARCLR